MLGMGESQGHMALAAYPIFRSRSPSRYGARLPVRTKENSIDDVILRLVHLSKSLFRGRRRGGWRGIKVQLKHCVKGQPGLDNR
jgi:hypothetical protein